MNFKEMWSSCKEKASQGKDINSGGLGRLKYDGKVYVGGLWLNVAMYYRPEESLVKFSHNSPLPASEPFELTDSEFAIYINR